MNNDLYLGNCLEVMTSIPDNSVDMILCDLPYGTTACKWDAIIPFEPLWEQYRRIAKKKAAIVLTASQPFTSALIMSNIKEFKYEWVWRKNTSTGFALAKRQPLRNHESVCVFYREQPTYNPQMTQRVHANKTEFASFKRNSGKSNHVPGLASISAEYDPNKVNPKTVLDFDSVPNSHGLKQHPTQKPTPLMEYLIRTYTNEGETVLDNTMGSGTTGVACVNTGRNFIGIEMDPGYFAIAQQRIEAARQSL